MEAVTMVTEKMLFELENFLVGCDVSLDMCLTSVTHLCYRSLSGVTYRWTSVSPLLSSIVRYLLAGVVW